MHKRTKALILLSLFVLFDRGSCPFLSADYVSKPYNSELENVYHIGDLPLLKSNPDFYPTAELQLNNTNTTVKIKPKTSKEITSNFVGSTPPRLPRSQEFDLQPFKREHLIDGDKNTLWMNRGQARPNVQQEWIRVDLPYEMQVKQVTIWPVKPEYGGWPENITVEISTDGYNWKTVYHTPNHAPLPGFGPVELPFKLQSVKQVLLKFKNLRQVTLGATEGAVPLGYGICIGDIEVIDSSGSNIALLSRGAGVTVSSTNYGYGDKRSLQDMLWPIHYDLGIKHIKIAYWDSTLNWHYVEQEKGVYKIDPRTDEAITQAVDNGIEVYMTLCYGNWLYSDAGQPPMGNRFWQFPFQKPPVPLSDEQIKAFCDYCHFIVEHFKGRIKYYEIWNEQNISYSWPPNKVKAFCKLVKAATKTVKETDPAAKVLLGGVCFMDTNYFEQMFKEGVAEAVDVICWHPYQWEVAPEEAYVPLYNRQDASIEKRTEVSQADRKKYPYKSYREVVAKIQELAVKYGFKGKEYHANETTWVSPYPSPDLGVPGGPVTEMVKAKYVARTIALHSDMGIPVYYNETWNCGIVYWDVSVLRATFSADPVSPMWPQPVYYVLRTMATITDSAKPDPDLNVKIDGLKVPYEICRLKLSDGSKLIGLWLTQRAKDVCQTYPVKITILDYNASKATGIDPINGIEQQLCFDVIKRDTVIPDVLITDYPVMLRIR